MGTSINGTSNPGVWQRTFFIFTTDPKKKGAQHIVGGKQIVWTPWRNPEIQSINNWGITERIPWRGIGISQTSSGIYSLTPEGQRLIVNLAQAQGGSAMPIKSEAPAVDDPLEDWLEGGRYIDSNDKQLASLVYRPNRAGSWLSQIRFYLLPAILSNPHKSGSSYLKISGWKQIVREGAEADSRITEEWGWGDTTSMIFNTFDSEWRGGKSVVTIYFSPIKL